MMPLTSIMDALSAGWLPAYMDPGSGSLLLQLLLGGVAGAVVALKLFWHRLSSFLRPASEPRDQEKGR